MNHTIVRISFLTLLIISLSACSSLNSGLRWLGMSSKLSNTELNDMIATGTRMSLDWASGETSTITYHSDGSTAVESGGESTRGTWSIEDKKLCLNSTAAGVQPAQCYSVYRNKKGTLKFYDENGELAAESTLPGVSS